MDDHRGCTRRGFLSTAAAAGGGAVLAGWLGGPPARADEDGNAAKGAAEVTPAEDLMFEHGLIGRMLLIFATAADALEPGKDAPVAAVADTAGLLRKFSENYHEKVEESEVFPRLVLAGRHIELVKTLKAQHAVGRKLIDRIRRLTQGGKLAEPARLAAALRGYARMFVPHVDREDAVVFRAFQRMLPAGEYRELGERLEDAEHRLLGEDGFEKTLARVGEIEKQLGIADLARFTAKP